MNICIYEYIYEYIYIFAYIYMYIYTYTLFVEITTQKQVLKFSQTLKRDATSFSKHDMNFLLSESDMIISRPVSKETKQNRTGSG